MYERLYPHGVAHATMKDTEAGLYTLHSILIPERAERHVDVRCVLQGVFPKQLKRAMRRVCATPCTKPSPLQSFSLPLGSYDGWLGQPVFEEVCVRNPKCWT